MYVAGNPVSFNDPSGHKWGKSLWHKITGAMQGEDKYNSINPVSLIKRTGNAIKDGWNKTLGSKEWRDSYFNKETFLTVNAVFITSILIALLPLTELAMVFLLGTVQFKEGSDWNDLNSFNELKKNTYWDWDGASIKEWKNQCAHITGSLAISLFITPGGGPLFGIYNEFAQYYGWKIKLGEDDDENRKSGERERDAIFWLPI